MSGTSTKLMWRLVVLGTLLAILPATAMAQTWTYQYDSVADTGAWSWGDTQRFRYDYAHQQWQDTGQYGGWQDLGDPGFSPVTRENGAGDPNFLGNGSWHTVGTGLSFMYVQGADSNRWKVNGNFRFSYAYNWGLWYDYYAATNTWSLMGSGLSSGFLGDGDWHTVGTGLTYQYSQGGDSSRWKVNGAYRFAYLYSWGLWYDCSSRTNTWSLMGSGLSSDFLGDGDWHTVGTGLSYQYSQAGDSSRWRVNGAYRFAYSYAWGLWYDYYGRTDAWSLLAGGLSSAFLGDGNWHTVGTGLSYQYLKDGDSSRWKVDGNYRFAYSYAWGVWYDYYAASWHQVGSPGLSQAFIGDGEWHETGPYDFLWEDNYYEYYYDDTHDFRVNPAGQWKWLVDQTSTIWLDIPAGVTPDASWSPLHMVQDINPGTSHAWPWYFEIYDGAMFFAATDGVHGYELWKYDGTTASMVVDLNPDGDSIPAGNFGPMAVYNGALYFGGHDGGVHGYALWKYYEGQVTLANDLAGAYQDPDWLAVYGTSLYFSCLDTTNGWAVWKYDGTQASMVADVNPGWGYEVTQLVVYNGALYFNADDGAYGRELWKYDGNQATRITDINPNASSLYLGSGPTMTVYNGALYFSADDGSGYELWRYNGANVSMVADINTSGGSDPHYPTVYNGALYFTANDGVNGRELWRYDGAGATRITDLQGNMGAQTVIVFNGNLYFDTNYGRDMWVYDGTNLAETEGMNSLVDGSWAIVYDGHLYGIAGDLDHGVELYQWL